MTYRVSVTAVDLAGPDAPAALERLRQSGPVTWVADIAAWVVTDWQLAVDVMRDAVTFTVDDPRFSTARVVGASMLSLDGVDHQRHRAPFVGAFRPGRIQQRFGAEVEALAANLVERVAGNGHADLRADLAGPMSVAVVTSALGLHNVDTATVLGWYTAIAAAVSAISAGGPPGPAAAAAVAALAEQVHTGKSAGSLLQAAADALDEADVQANAAVLMFGGIETTEGMIANAIVQLLENPPAADEVRADPSLAGAAVEESLRLQPAAAVVDRYATRDVEISGAHVAQGDLVRVSITAANRDPAVFAEPGRFDLHRTNVRSQLAFARGPHVCVAMDLARLEARVALRTVLARLPGLRLAAPTAATGLVFRKPAHVRVMWDATR